MVSNSGYRTIQINGKRYLEHRLVWLYMTGSFPSGAIDHVNRNKLDNRWCNLRQATREENRRNSQAKGYWVRNNVFFARATIDGEMKHLGSFDSADDAHRAFVEANAQKYGCDFCYNS